MRFNKSEILGVFQKFPYVFVTSKEMLCFDVKDEGASADVKTLPVKEGNANRRGCIYMDKEYLKTINDNCGDELVLEVVYDEADEVYQLSFDKKILIDMSVTGVRGLNG